MDHKQAYSISHWVCLFSDDFDKNMLILEKHHVKLLKMNIIHFYVKEMKEE